VRCEVADGKVIVSGFATFVEQKQAMLDLLGAVGVTGLVDDVETPPSTTLGEKRFAVVTAPRAPLYSKPGVPRERVTELSANDPVFLLREADGHLLCLGGPDGYAGYIVATDVERIDAPKFASIINAKNAKNYSSDSIDAIIETAMSLRGTRYVWGGTTSAGIDCSGLVQSSFKSQGINLPRDADQQVYVGRLVATRWHRDALRRGDLLFFLGRRGTVSHVAIYLGDQKFIEAADEGVKITSFDPTDPSYSRRRAEGFCFAKRVLD
jgi:hypothetical protein